MDQSKANTADTNQMSDLSLRSASIQFTVQIIPYVAQYDGSNAVQMARDFYLFLIGDDPVVDRPRIEAFPDNVIDFTTVRIP